MFDIIFPLEFGDSDQFELALKDHESGELYTTQVNGINGGMVFFTTLPNTGIEVDIPVYGRYTPPTTPDGGIVPDLPVEWSVEDLLQERNPDLEAIFEFVNSKQ